MGSLLSASLGFDAITKDDLIGLGFRPYRPISKVFGEPRTFEIELVVTNVNKYSINRKGNKVVGRFQLIVDFPRTLSPNGNPVAVLTRILLGNGGGNVYDNENSIVELDCDLPTLKTMMDENYLRSLI